MILIAEDEEEFARFYCRALQFHGFSAECFRTAHEILEFLSISKPELIILDIKLPDGNGLDLAKEIRTRGYDGPMIAMSGLMTLMNRDDFIPPFIAAFQKPLRLNELIDIVRQATGQEEGNAIGNPC